MHQQDTRTRWLKSLHTFGTSSAILFFFFDVFVECDAFGCKVPNVSDTLSRHLINMLLISCSLQMFPYILSSCLLSLVSRRLFSHWRRFEYLSFCQVLHKAGVSHLNLRDFIPCIPLPMENIKLII